VWLPGAPTSGLQAATKAYVDGLAGVGGNSVQKSGDTMSGALNLPSNGLVVGTNQLAVSGGNVGIGTNSPAYRLDVTNSGSVDDGIHIQSGNSTNTIMARDNGGIEIAALQSGQPINLKTSGLSRMFLTGGGNVGIGTTSPTAPLDVKQVSVLGGTAGNNILVSRTQTAGGSGGNIVYHTEWRLRNATGTDWGTHKIHDGISVDGSFVTPGTDTRTYWERDPASDTQSWGTGTNAYLTLRTGNVGIGATSPSSRLEVDAKAATDIGQIVKGFASQSGDLQQYQNSSGAVLSKVDAAGYVWLPGAPTSGLQAATKAYVDGLAGVGGNSVQKSGDTMSGALNLPSNGLVVGTNQLTVSSGNVGVGTTTPTADLEVATTAGTFGKLRLWGRTANAAIEFWKDTPATAAANIGMSPAGGAATDDLVFSTYASSTWSERMRLSNAGNLGIGTTTPQTKLEVYKSSGTQGANQDALTINSGGVYTGGPTTNTTVGLNFNLSQGDIGPGYTYGAIRAGEDTGTGAIQGSLRFLTQSYSAGPVLNERMRISSGGNVGIGTIAPTSKLEISSGDVRDGLTVTAGYPLIKLNATNASANARNWGLYTTTLNQGDLTLNQSNTKGGDPLAGTSRFFIDPSGNVGLGTTTPTYKLETVTSSPQGFRLQTSTSTVGVPQIDMLDPGRANEETVMSSTDGTTVGTYLASYSNHPLLFGTYAGSTPTAKMAILQNGNVGIGTTAPSQPLQVQRDQDAYTGINVKNTTSNTNAQAGVSATGQNNSVGINALSDAYVRPYPGYHPGATLITASSTGGLNIVSNIGTGTVGANTGAIRFITDTSAGGISTNTGGNDIETRMIITGAGNVGIGTTAPNNKLTVGNIGSGGAGQSAYDIGTNRIAANSSIYSYDKICAGNTQGDCNGTGFGSYMDTGGNFKGNAYNTWSDIRLKKNIQNIKPGLLELTKLRPVQFNWIDQKASKETQYGFIAQEIEKVLPTLVETNAKSGIKSVNYVGLISPIVAGIKDLYSKVITLIAHDDINTAAIAKLKLDNEKKAAEIKDLQARLERLEQNQDLGRKPASKSKRK
jgi:hypothetical protein